MTALAFQHTWRWIVDHSPHTGEPKTQTRRLSLDEDCLMVMSEPGRHVIQKVYTATGRSKWEVGKTCAIKPGRTSPSVMWKAGSILFASAYDPQVFQTITGREWKADRLAEDWNEARVCIKRIWHEDVRKISVKDCVAEGFKFPFDFLEVWTQMHDRPAWKIYQERLAKADVLDSLLFHNHLVYLETRPADRYAAWGLEFEFVH